MKAALIGQLFFVCLFRTNWLVPTLLKRGVRGCYEIILGLANAFKRKEHLEQDYQDFRMDRIKIKTNTI
jgi:hypothetical protein